MLKELADLARAAYLQTHPYYWWQPRPDNAAEFDQQQGFVDSKSLVSIALGGNGSGKSSAAAMKAARFVLHRQPPPRPDCPFWIISDTYEQSCGMGWVEKLSQFIPREFVEWDRISWVNARKGWPSFVPLKAWEGRPGKNWAIEFKSYEQGREGMQARSVGGAWFSEQFPMEIFQEVFRGFREYAFPGGLFAEMTPLNPTQSEELKEKYFNPPEGWKFFRLNTEENLKAGGIQKTWYDSFMASTPTEMLETRKIGAFAGYVGTIFPYYNPAIHCRPNVKPPFGCIHYRGFDWGASEEHPFTCVWAAQDGQGDWYIYDEYWSDLQVDAEYHAKYVYERHPWKNAHFYAESFGDPSRPDLLHLFNRKGIPIEPANNEVLPGIDTIRRLLGNPARGLKPRIIIDSVKCPKLASQIGTVRWRQGVKKGANPGTAQPAVLKRNDDLFDSLRYLLHSVSMKSGWERPKGLDGPKAPAIEFEHHKADQRKR